MQSILLLHGALGSPQDLATLAAALTGRGFQVHRLPFSGHGQVAFGNSFGIPGFAGEVEQYIRQHHLEQAPIFGYSMGGFVALHLASQTNGLVGRIITLGTKFNWSKEAVDKETAGLNPEAMLQKVPAFAGALEQKHGPAWKELVAKTAELMREIHALDLLNADCLKRIQNKVLIGIGDKDRMVSLEETVAVYKNLPNASMYMLPATKHPVETADAGLLSTLIAGFIAND